MKLKQLKMIRSGNGYAFYMPRSVFRTLGIFELGKEYDVDVPVQEKSDSFKKESLEQRNSRANTPALFDLVRASKFSQYCCAT